VIDPIPHPAGLAGLSYLLILGMLGVAVVLTFIRLYRGPKLADRVIALDLLAIESIGIIVNYAMALNRQMLIDVAIVLALLAFLGTVAFARYLEKRVEP